ncbi:uncharacterized protein K489DRAFT_352616 [Dissoconium aciculare CBS 342.82]|uniref:Dolichyl-diphosphooligosaccharide-protein glycosyltransferase subunit OST5 n=1 Tax=Dissoconium aciculare CBS 342.82 TaxID=1314786 RepID=A0A6J3MEJ1_9PEZI|nr:uncharacterized protein K489DRAFT_352616 [Dissoconium aciculare CBS 342.82]KAF1825272.1 hypothetical protein K489DRAFT_352616 [Dissoconium aciculare CBS 342.82]
MSAPSLRGLWDDAANSPFESTIPKDSQFTIATVLLLTATILTSLFGLDLKLKNIPLYAIPAALAFGFGSVFMICAVGVYV